MEALLLTIAMAALMVVVLALVARSWPRSSGLGGYRTRTPAAGDPRPPVREDDDAQWNWTDVAANGDESAAETPARR